MGKVWVTWNVRGMCQAVKRKVVKHTLGKIKPDLILLQETKLDVSKDMILEDWLLLSTWSAFRYRQKVQREGLLCCGK